LPASFLALDVWACDIHRSISSQLSIHSTPGGK
jgi:hypothetical protein